MGAKSTTLICLSLGLFCEVHEHTGQVLFTLVLTCMLSHFSYIQLFATPWTIALQAPLSVGFPGKNTRVGCHPLLQENLLHPGIETMSPVSPVLEGGFFTTESPGKPYLYSLVPTW